MDNELLSHLNAIDFMARNNFINKDQYKWELNCLQKWIVVERKDSAMIDSLNAHMEKLSNMVNSVDSSSLSQFPLWLDYIKWTIWHHFRDNGIGHLKSFSLCDNHITCTIYLDFILHKNMRESKEEFENRKIQYNKFLKEHNLLLNESQLINNDYNNKFIVDYINSYVDGKLFKTTTINGNIDTITFSFCLNSKFLFENYKNNQIQNNKSNTLTTVDLESIVQDIQKWVDTLALYDDMQKLDTNHKLNDSATQLISSIYYNLCGIVGLENDTTKRYKEINQINRERNLEIRKKEEEIGSQYNLSDMFNISSNVYSNISKYLYRKYCLYLKELDFNEYPTIVVSFDTYQYYTNYEGYSSKKDSINLNKLNSILDIVYNSNCGDVTLELNTKNQKAFEEIIAKDLCCEVSSLEINYKKGKPNIQSVTYHILDWGKFLKKFRKKEEE